MENMKASKKNTQVELFHNIKDLNELWHFMKKNIDYAWTNKKHERRELYDDRMKEEYFIHSAYETIEDGCGICLDQVQLEKEFCEAKKIPYTMVCIQFKDKKDNYLSRGHTFMVAYEDHQYKYFERAFLPCANVVPFDSLEEAIVTVISYYIMCFDDLSIKSVNNMLIYIDPDYKVGMTTQEVFSVEINSENKTSEFSEQIKKKLKELRKISMSK